MDCWQDSNLGDFIKQKFKCRVLTADADELNNYSYNNNGIWLTMNKKLKTRIFKMILKICNRC